MPKQIMRLQHAGDRRLTIPVYDQVPINLLNWILAEARISREEFLKMLDQHVLEQMQRASFDCLSG